MNDKGFTLIETILYIALFGILISGGVIGAYNLIEASNRNISSTRTQEEATFLNRKINWALTGATSVTVSPPGNRITITRPDLGSQSPIVIREIGNMLTLTRGSGEEKELNNERFKIEDTLFYYEVGSYGRPDSISVNFKVGDKSFIFRRYLR